VWGGGVTIDVDGFIGLSGLCNELRMAGALGFGCCGGGGFQFGGTPTPAPPRERLPLRRSVIGLSLLCFTTVQPGRCLLQTVTDPQRTPESEGIGEPEQVLGVLDSGLWANSPQNFSFVWFV